MLSGAMNEPTGPSFVMHSGESELPSSSVAESSTLHDKEPQVDLGDRLTIHTCPPRSQSRE